MIRHYNMESNAFCNNPIKISSSPSQNIVLFINITSRQGVTKLKGWAPIKLFVAYGGAYWSISCWVNFGEKQLIFKKHKVMCIRNLLYLNTDKRHSRINDFLYQLFSLLTCKQVLQQSMWWNHQHKIIHKQYRE